MFTRLGTAIIAAVALLAAVFQAAIGAGSNDRRATAHAVTVDVTASIPDFDGDGTIGFGDFVKFSGKFGQREDDDGYDALYDLNDDGEIGFSDFVIFAQNFGREAPPPVVAIPDADLRAAIVAALDKDSGAPITRAEMATLDRLDAKDAGVSDLTGMEFAVNLTWLSLYDNDIEDISALADLINLERLWLSNNDIEDISALAKLAKLTELWLSNNRIEDISALFGLTGLTRLSLGHNNLTDISVLSGLTRLQELYLESNPGLSGALPGSFTGLTSLNALWLHGTGLCVSRDAAAQTWIAKIGNKRGVVNCGPVTVATIPGQAIAVGSDATTMQFGAAFAHPNNNVLTYSAFSEDESVTQIEMSGETLSITPVAEGATTVTVTATDSAGLGATLAFPVSVEHVATRRHNIVLRVVHVTTDWMPYASWGGWPDAAKPKESAALKYFEVAIWDETASVHLYEFDNDFNPVHDAGTDPARIAYREQYVVRKHTGMPSNWIARQDFVKSTLMDFARYIAERYPDSDHHLIYSGHGGPGGRLFAGHLSQEGAAEFLQTWRAVLGRRLGVVDMGGPCNKGALSDLENFCGHARFYIASDLPNGGFTMDDWTIEKYDEVDENRQYHALLARNADLETALKERIDLRRKRYEYSRQYMIANKVEQANYLYSCTNFMSEFGWNVRLFIEQSGGRYDYGTDLWKYLTENDASKPLLEMFDQAIIHDANNRDFFPWEEVANGIMMCCED